MPVHMIEALDYKPYMPNDPGYRYLCIQACFPTPSKSTTDRSKVTCKNCLRAMKKDG